VPGGSARNCHLEQAAAAPAAEISPGPEASPLALAARPAGAAAWLGASGATAKLPAPAPNVQLGPPDVPIVLEAYTLCRACSCP